MNESDLKDFKNMKYLYLKWVDYKTQNKYVIGALCKDIRTNKYYFKLSEDYINIANQAGFSMAVLPFSDTNRIYESDSLFSFFKIRVPKVERLDEEDLKDLLEEYDMAEFDEFEFLRKTKGEIMTDSFILEEEK